MPDEDVLAQIDELRHYAEMKQRELDEIIARYGEGVRPAWVSTDIAIAQAKIRGLKKQIDDLERKALADKHEGGK